MFTFRYEISAGWARATMSDGHDEATVIGSYISEALGTLLDAVARSLRGEPNVQCEWQDEPGGSRWVFNRDGADVRMTVLGFSAASMPGVDQGGTEVFSVTLRVVRLGRVLLSEAQRVLDELGEDGYLDEWRRPFPHAEMERLRTAIKS